MKPNRWKSTIALTLSLLSSLAHADQPLPDETNAIYASRTKPLVYSSPTGKSLNYRLFLPENYEKGEKFPLVLAFHGAGERGSDNRKHLRPFFAGFTSPALQKEHPCIVVMPQCPTKQQWVNTPWAKGSYSLDKTPPSEPMTLVRELFDDLLKTHKIDPSRVYVIGASMGGYGCWNFIMNYPDIPAAAVPICGGGDPSQAPKLTNLPIWAFHGDKDTVVPPSATTDMVNAIQKAGGEKIKLTMYKGVAHNSYSFAWKDPEMLKWMFASKR